MNGLPVTRLVSPTAWSALRDDWNRLARGRVLLSYEWLESWWQAFQADRELYLLRVDHPTEGLVGIAPWYRTSCLTTGRVVRFLGDGKACTDYMSVLVAEDHEFAVAESLAQWLADQCGDAELGWDLLELEAVDAAQPVMNGLIEQLQARGSQTSVRSGPPCWRLRCAASWADYPQCLSSSARRKAKKLARDYQATGRATLRWAGNAEERQQCVRMLIDFHEGRWQQVGVEGCFSYAGFRPFIEQAASRLGDQDRARLACVEIDGTPAAAVLWLRNEDGGWCLYQCGMNWELREHQPGWLMNLLCLEAIHQQGAPYCDYLRGDERYKRELGAEPVEQVEIRASAPHLAGRLRGSLQNTKDRLRDWARTLVGTTQE